jgi:hypothetical protein
MDLIRTGDGEDLSVTARRGQPSHSARGVCRVLVVRVASP